MSLCQDRDWVHDHDQEVVEWQRVIDVSIQTYGKCNLYRRM